MLKKLSVSLLLLSMAGALLAYAVCSHGVAARDEERTADCPLARLFPEFWRAKGRAAYYRNLNTGEAAALFRRAIALEPVMMDAWLDLARAELSMGRKERARKIADLLERRIPHVSTWKWDELLLAYDMRREGYFASCLNFILLRLPSRASEACGLAARYWGGWVEVLPHVLPANHAGFLTELMKARQPDAAYALWSRMRETSGPSSEGARAPDGTETARDGPPGPLDDMDLRFCRFLMDSGRLVEAKAVWKRVQGGSTPGMADGGFEKPPLNQAFGWKFDRSPHVDIERSPLLPGSGSHSLHLRFRGTANVSFQHVSQVVPVEPGRGYVLRFLRKSRNLTTDQGIFIQITGFQCKGLLVQSRPVTGSLPWGGEELRFAAPGGCETVLFQVRRRESHSFDSKISGEYWLDGVSLERDESSMRGEPFHGGAPTNGGPGGGVGPAEIEKADRLQS